ncbi:hypothetical protein MCW_01264, partial [Cardidatus Bartonella washoeensis 085-0475]
MAGIFSLTLSKGNVSSLHPFIPSSLHPFIPSSL